MILTLTGPTCGGKSTVERVLQGRGWGRAISHTTRPARTGEQTGVDYHFINDTTYDAMYAAGDFIETVELGPRRYAMSKQSLDLAAEQGNVVIVVEPHGAQQIHNYCLAKGMPSKAVWLDCGVEEQARRWLKRTVGEIVQLDGVVRVDAEKYVGAAAERLALMLTIENTWRECAHHAWINTECAREYDMRLMSLKAEPEELADMIELAVLKRR